MQSEQYLFKKGTFAMPPSIYTSYEANLTLHESHEMAPRLFMTSDIDSTFTTDAEGCSSDTAVIKS